MLWYDWSHAFDRIDMRLSNPSNPAFAALTPARDRFPLDWKDSISVRLGHEYFLTGCDVLRMGYVYTSPTVPRSTLTPYIPATLEHTFSAGYGRQQGATRIDLAYQYGFGATQRVKNSRLFGGDFDFSKVRSQAHWLYLSVTKEF